MIFLFENFAESRLVSGITAGATVLRLPPGDAAKWPQPVGAERASVVLYDGVQAPEVVYLVTNPGTGEITVTRGEEGSGAKAWQAGTAIINTPTRVSLSYLSSGGSDSWHQTLVNSINEAKASIASERQLRIDGDGALAARIDTVEVAFGTNTASVQTLQQSFADINTAWANYQVSVTAQAQGATANATQALNASVSNGSSIATLRTDVETAVGTNFAAFAQKIQAFTDFDEAQVVINTSINSRVGTAESSLTSEISLRTTQYDAQVINNSSQQASIGSNTAAITTEQTTRASETSALASRASALEAEVVAGRGGQASLAARITSVESVAATNTSAVASRATTLEAQMANTQGSGLQSRISTEESVRAAADAALATRTTTLETDFEDATAYVFVTSPVTGDRLTSPVTGGALIKEGAVLAARITAVETAASTATGAVATRTTTLEAQMANASASGLQARISTEETARVSGDGALATRATALEAEVTGARGGESTVAARITAVESAAASATGAVASRATTLEAQMADTANSGLRSRIATEETVRAGADSALASRATTLEAQVGNTASSGLQSRIATEETARVNADNALASRATTLEAQMANTSASGLQARIATEESARVSGDAAEASARSQVRTDFEAADATLTAAINSEISARSSADSALASRASSLEATVDTPGTGLTARVTTTESVAIDARTTARAAYGVTLDVNGYVSGFSSVNNGATASFQILADRFGIRDPSGTNAVEYIDGTWRVQEAGETTRFRQGKPFGGVEKIVYWIGASSIALGDETKANADVYIAMTAPRFGGTATSSSTFTAQCDVGARSGTRTGAGVCTTSGAATVTHAGETGTVTFQWTRLPGGSAININSPTSASTFFNATLANGETKEASFSWAATDGGSTRTVTGIVNVILISNV